jgi:hypothetical protein
MNAVGRVPARSFVGAQQRSAYVLDVSGVNATRRIGPFSRRSLVGAIVALTAPVALSRRADSRITAAPHLSQRKYDLSAVESP